MSTQNSNSIFSIKHPKFYIEISQHSGFCFGVVNAITKAEQNLTGEQHLYSIGNIVHNSKEVERLTKLGLEVIELTDVDKVSNKNILFRAHGEPPESYAKIKLGNNRLIDATCPVVLKIQERIHKAYQKALESNGQIVIFGKNNHAEVIGLLGQTQYKAILLENEADFEKIDFNRPIELFSQTTKSLSEFQHLSKKIEEKAMKGFKSNDTICRQVSNRQIHILEFAKKFELILFVGDTNSSNSKVLYNACKTVNSNSYFISDASDIDKLWLHKVSSVGISGATSAPNWLMKEVAYAVEQQLLTLQG